MPSVKERSFDLMTIICSYLKDNDIKRDDDVHDLYLGNCGLTELADLSRFRFLQHLWLHGNRLSELCLPHQPKTSFLNICYRVSELYLNDNDIKSIAGMLSQLRCLQVLMLQNNQLEDLDEAVHELKPMRALSVLNLLYNPLSQVKGYRLHLVNHCPSLQLLDRQAVTAKEKVSASQTYDEKQTAVKATIAFGRRAEGLPISMPKSKSTVQEPPETLEEAKDKNQASRSSLSLERLVRERTMKKSAMQFTTLDWSLVPNRERRVLGETAPRPQNITVRFR